MGAERRVTYHIIRQKVRYVTLGIGCYSYTLEHQEQVMSDFFRLIMSKMISSLPLQRKVSLTLVLLFAAFIVVSFAVLRTVIAPAFDDLELSAARTDLKRAESAIRADIENLEALSADWAPWDDIFHYVRGENPGFEKSNLFRATLTNLNLDMMAVYGADNTLKWAQVFLDGEEVPLDRLAILDAGHPSFALLTRHHDSVGQTVGFIDTGLGPMIVSSRPIVRSDYSGPIAGAVIMGQFLNESRLLRLQERIEVDMGWEFAAASTSSDDVIQIDAGAAIEIFPGTILSQRVLNDIHGTPYLILRAHTPRDISSLGSQTINAAMTFLVIAGLIVIGFMWFILRGTILRPIEQLTRHIDDIRQSGDLSRQLGMRRGDEIGILAGQFDVMTAEVHDARRSLLDQSFKAGKADTAAEVLHNIRNAMTPMINGLERLRKASDVTDKLRIGEATRQVANPDCPAERKKKFLEYINASFEHVSAVGANAAKELKIVISQARQVEGILANQEKFANVAPVAENIIIDEVLDEAVNIIPKDAEPSVLVTMSDQLHSVRVRAHRIGLLQVMGNLILNAYESIQRSGTSAGQIFLLAVNEIFDDKPMVRVTIRDNGSGFDADVRDRIFRRGFTSKTRGETTGLGLHWCANAVAGMGGRIFAESAGRGQGAEFHVLLPAAQGG